MHRLAVKFGAMLCRTFTARREISMVAFTVIEAMVDMAVEMIAAMEPGTGSDE